MKRFYSSCIRGQRGVVWWIPAIVIAVVVIVIAAAAVITSSPAPEAGTPPPGCFPAGTQCRIFIQNEVSCCSGQPVVGKRIGWCLGWYDALPCK